MEGDDYHFKFKVVILGDKAVGKTSFLDCTIAPMQPSARPSGRPSTRNTPKK